MNTKQKVLLGLAGLTALAVAGGSVGTMAWFYSNTTVTASGLSMSVNAPTNEMEIRSDSNGSWGSTVNLNSTTNALSPSIALFTTTSGTATTYAYGVARGSKWNPITPCSVKFYVPTASPDASGVVSGFSYLSTDTSSAFGATGSISSVSNGSGSKYYALTSFETRCRSWKGYPENSSSANFLSYKYTITPSGTWSPIYAALRLLVVSFVPSTSSVSGSVVECMQNHRSTESYTICSVCNSAGTGFLSSISFWNYYCNKSTGDCFIDVPFKTVIIAWLDGNDPACVTANTTNVSTVSFSVSMSYGITTD